MRNRIKNQFSFRNRYKADIEKFEKIALSLNDEPLDENQSVTNMV